MRFNILLPGTCSSVSDHQHDQSHFGEVERNIRYWCGVTTIA
ncbi:hypothetical protein BVRB_9g215720 [Beta vulgaris subsp. vulgaris]|nr:hypothetical protein BVRB_9g215720 [Beta vulgaris subsp. vulgaris]